MAYFHAFCINTLLELFFCLYALKQFSRKIPIAHPKYLRELFTSRRNGALSECARRMDSGHLSLGWQPRKFPCVYIMVAGAQLMKLQPPSTNQRFSEGSNETLCSSLSCACSSQQKLFSNGEAAQEWEGATWRPIMVSYFSTPDWHFFPSCSRCLNWTYQLLKTVAIKYTFALNSQRFPLDCRQGYMSLVKINLVCGNPNTRSSWAPNQYHLEFQPYNKVSSV